MQTLNYNLSANLDFITKRGDTFNPKPFVVQLVSGSVSQSADFTDFHAIMQIKENKTDDTAVLTLTDTNGYISLVSGSISIEVDAETMDISPGDYYYDLEMIYPDTTIKTWLQGKFKIKQDVTR